MLLGVPENLSQILKPFGFGERLPVAGRASLAAEFKAKGRSGLYLLDFEGGELYAGLTTDVVKRLGQHRKAHGDIIGLRFAPCPEVEQAGTERRLIGTLEGAGFALRNVALMSVVTGERDIDALIPPEEQDDWMDGLELIDATERVDDSALRARHRRRFERFEAMGESDEAVKLLRLYVMRALPKPRLTELSFWSLSCLPSGGGGGDFTLLARISLNMMEVMTLLCDSEGIWASFHIAESPLIEGLGEDYATILEELGYEIEDHSYAPGGADQIKVRAPSFVSVIDFLNDGLLVCAARTMNLRLIRKGPTYYPRSHSLPLADRIFSR